MEKQLHALLSNLHLMYVKLHHHHWFVSGPEFYTLHQTFETLYKDMSTYYDEVAERMIMIHLKPLSSMQDYMKHKTLDEAKEILSSHDMVRSIIADFKVILDMCHNLIKDFDQLSDFVSADLMIKIKGAIDKHIWMLGSLLK
jgi:starvation-inducible DNA-binding protein